MIWKRRLRDGLLGLGLIVAQAVRNASPEEVDISGR